LVSNQSQREKAITGKIVKDGKFKMTMMCNGLSAVARGNATTGDRESSKKNAPP
jgi:hypothetical protein